MCWIRNWEVVVDFKVAGKGKDLFGDGLAFWYARDRMIMVRLQIFLNFIFKLTLNSHRDPSSEAKTFSVDLQS